MNKSIRMTSGGAWHVFVRRLLPWLMVSLTATALTGQNNPTACPVTGAPDCQCAAIMEEANAPLPHPDDPGKQKEHMALFDLVPRSSATHATVNSGAWNNTNTWANGVVPGAGAKVLICEGHTVTYNANSSASLDWVRVDGTLNFNPNVNTRMVVEHLIIDPGGVFNMGTASYPIAANRTAIIEIDTTRGPINQAPAADPLALGRGVISHGATNVYGAPKKAHTTLLGDAYAGNSTLILSDSSIPEGWRVGDTLVVAGTTADMNETNNQNWFGVGSTSTQADRNNERFRDEIIEITSLSVVNGRVHVQFINRTNSNLNGLNVLAWDHTRPSGSLFSKNELRVHIANLTRNAVLKSSDATVDVQERGHFMVMHNNNAQLHHLLVKDFGRSNKAIVADDPAALGNFNGTPSTGTNPRGRYGLHLHRIGAQAYDDSHANVNGCVVWGSPGWGIVHHDSYAILENNVVFDVVGAGIVAEDGNELGTWRNNLVIKATGAPNSDFDDNILVDSGRNIRFDLGFVGSGYWIQGGAAGLIIEDNIAISCNAAGFDIVPKTGLTPLPAPTFPTELLRIPQMRQQMLDAGITEIAINSATSAPIRGITVYNSFRGIHTWLHKRNDHRKEYNLLDQPNGAHPFHMIVENIKIWNVQTGIQNMYSQSMTFRNALIVGNPQNPIPMTRTFTAQDNNVDGLALSSNAGSATNLHFDNIRIEGFEYGMRTVQSYNSTKEKHSPYSVGSLRNSQMANVRYAFIGSSERVGALFYPYFELENNAFSSTEATQAPIASFSYQNIDGFAVRFDASASYDPDGHRLATPDAANIVSYAWDFNGNGQFDAWGIDTVINYGSPGPRTVTLTVFDSHGVSSSTTQTVNVTASDYGNPIVDSGFNQASGAVINTRRFNSGFRAMTSMDRNDGWFGHNLENRGGYLRAIGTPRFGQAFRDEYVRQGQQNLTLRIKHTATTTATADLFVTVYGVNGQFYLANEDPSAGAIRPVQNSIEPVESMVLIRENIGGPKYNNWTNLTLEGDFGAGYEYIVIHVAGTTQNPANGDVFEIDSMTLTGPAPSGSEALIDLEELPLTSAPTILAVDSNMNSWSFEGLPGVHVKTYTRNNSRVLGTTFNGDAGFRFFRTDGAAFSLVGLELVKQVSNRTYTLTGHLANGGTISTPIFIAGSAPSINSFEFDGWSNLVALEIDNGNLGDGRIFVDNIRIFGGGETGVVNVAANKEGRWGSHTQSWAQSSSQSTTHLTDGDTATGVGTATNSNLPYQWLGVDLGDERSIRTVNLLWSNARHRAVDYEIETSTDAVNWTSHVTIDGNPDVATTDNFAPVNARYVRVKVIRGNFAYESNTMHNRVALMEIEVY